VARLRGGARLLACQPFSMRPRQLAPPRAFIQVLRRDMVGNDADLGKKGKPARACGSQDEFGRVVCQDAGAII
jgi:hypothetical protein